MEYISIINSLLRIIEMSLRDDCNHREDGSFKYVPLDVQTFHNKMTEIMNPDVKTFLDVGCGIGDKCLIAEKIFGLEVTGIEIDSKLVEIAKKYFINQVIEIDAMNFKDYNKFDIIYTYTPYQDDKKQKLLVDLISSKKREDAIFINVM